MPRGMSHSSKYNFLLILFFVRVTTIQFFFLLVYYFPVVGETILDGKGLSSTQ